MKSIAIILALSTFMTLSFNVYAKDKVDVFQKMDKNNDGKLTKGEFARGNKKQKRVFRKLDTNEDGFLSREEAAKRKGKKGKKNK